MHSVLQPISYFSANFLLVGLERSSAAVLQCCATQAARAPIDGITALDFSRFLGSAALCCSAAGVEASIGLTHHSVKRNNEKKKSNKNLLSKMALTWKKKIHSTCQIWHFFLFLILNWNYFSIYSNTFLGRLNLLANSQRIKLLNLSQESVNNENSVLQTLISVSFENSSGDWVTTTACWSIAGNG